MTSDDLPLNLLRLYALQEQLDEWLETKRNPEERSRYRFFSTAASRPQTDFYSRVAASPAIKTICEVGFNAGHSTAIWLTSNPSAVVYSFDLFDHTFSDGSVIILQRRFPGRLHIVKGDSVCTVPKWRKANPLVRCDLVHVDGYHSFLNVVADFLNLRMHSHQHTLYLFDDQCDPSDCHSSISFDTALACTLATCDLARAGYLEQLVGFYNGSRQFALFRSPVTLDALASRETWKHRRVALPTLPCTARRCEIADRSPKSRHWGVPRSLRHQDRIRPASCDK